MNVVSKDKNVIVKERPKSLHFCPKFGEISYSGSGKKNNQAPPIFLPLSFPTKHHSHFQLIFSHIFRSPFSNLPKITSNKWPIQTVRPGYCVQCNTIGGGISNGQFTRHAHQDNSLAE